ncbi:hypothetical protein Rifp1Sym_fs00010 [endosymbiont of Riftia pachyptila (vent Ph05)]|uniref:Uncharacterized protein n=1 Tax=endosymbiont of Riftia pachyptila (vent Ph05) TaxID=1048808 RepID=G2DHS2_9GAMM|nr:hypothetical protein Rifp1Sym_fs00010 [endosymbiont of Riftia pachyptila (vent Ph05)]
MQLLQRLGDQQQRLLHRRVRRSACCQRLPGTQRLFKLLLAEGGPAQRQQRPVGVDTLQSHPLQRRLGGGVLPRLEQQQTEQQVGAVAQGTVLFVVGIELAQLLEQCSARLLPPLTKLCQRPVEEVKTLPIVILSCALQLRCRQARHPAPAQSGRPVRAAGAAAARAGPRQSVRKR